MSPSSSTDVARTTHRLWSMPRSACRCPARRPRTLSATIPGGRLCCALARPDGVSILATLDAERARSPIDRYGSVTFVRRVRAGETVTLTAESRDSPDIVGEACLSMDLLPPSDSASDPRGTGLRGGGAQRRSRRRARAPSGSTSTRPASSTLRPFRAAEARHAMAEIAYVPLAHEDDAFWLARSALAGYAARSRAAPPPGLMSGLLALEARTLLESGTLHRRRASRARARPARASRQWAKQIASANASSRASTFFAATWITAPAATRTPPPGSRKRPRDVSS